MSCTYVILLAVVVVGYCAASAASQTHDNVQPIIWKSLENIIKRKCLKTANQNKYEEVLTELINLKNQHWHSIIIEEPTFEAHPHIHCHSRKPEIQGYLHRFAEKFETCLDNKENYLQQFILRGYENYSHYFCSNIKLLISDLPGNTTKCIKKFIEHPDISPHAVCYKRSRIFGSSSNVDVITKQELCEDLLNIRYCYAQSFNVHCADAAILRAFQLEIISKGLSDCQDVWYRMLKKYLKMQL